MTNQGEKRQAGIEDDGLRAARDDAGRLRFNTIDDALNHAAALLKRSNDALEWQVRGLDKRYIDGDIHFDAAAYVSATEIREFSLFAVPFVDDFHLTDVAIPANSHAAASVGDWRKDAVDVLVPHLVKTPEKFVPSLMRFKAKQVGVEIVGDIASTAFEFALNEPFFRVSEGEFGPGGILIAGEHDRCSKDGVVKRGSEGIQSIEGHAAKIQWDVPLDPDLAGFISGCWIEVGEKTIRFGGLVVPQAEPQAGHVAFGPPC